jgi:hypothetical protein
MDEDFFGPFIIKVLGVLMVLLVPKFARLVLQQEGLSDP